MKVADLSFITLCMKREINIPEIHILFSTFDILVYHYLEKNKFDSIELLNDRIVSKFPFYPLEKNEVERALHFLYTFRKEKLHRWTIAWFNALNDIEIITSSIDYKNLYDIHGLRSNLIL